MDWDHTQKAYLFRLLAVAQKLEKVSAGTSWPITAIDHQTDLATDQIDHSAGRSGIGPN